MKRIALIATIVIFSVLSICGSIYFTLSAAKPKSATVTPVVVEPIKFQDPALLNVLSSAGANVSKGLSISYSEQLPTPSARGWYVDGSITIKPGLDPEVERRVVVHEYLHYVWFRVMTPEQKLVLSDKLLTTFAADPAMQERLYRYTEQGILTSTELFSFYCTEVNDKVIASFVDECSKYFDRSTLTLLR